MTIYGYARTTTDDDLPFQKSILLSAGCEIVREETSSARTEKSIGASQGKKAVPLNELHSLIDIMMPDDVLVVTKLDRLARSMRELQEIMVRLQDKGIVVKTADGRVNSSKKRPFHHMMSVFADFEAANRRDRQIEGIAKAKAEGAFKGRPVSIDVEEVKRLAEKGLDHKEIADKMDISVPSVYRIMNKLKKES